MIVYAHRGASAELPENTVEAFRRALACGVDAIETDVHATRDGVVVVHHDETGQRMASIPRAVRDTSLEDVRRWNVGFGFRSPERALTFEPFRVPTLDHVLEAFPDTRFNIDVKAGPSMVPAVIELVRKHRAEQRVLLTAFEDATVRAVRALGYRGDTGMSRGEVLRALALPRAAPRALRPPGVRIQIPAAVGPLRLATPRVVERLQALGYAVDFWVVNDPALAREVAASGADGLMTDDPARIVPALG